MSVYVYMYMHSGTHVHVYVYVFVNINSFPVYERASVPLITMSLSSFTDECTFSDRFPYIFECAQTVSTRPLFCGLGMRLRSSLSAVSDCPICSLDKFTDELIRHSIYACA